MLFVVSLIFAIVIFSWSYSELSDDISFELAHRCKALSVILLVASPLAAIYYSLIIISVIFLGIFYSLIVCIVGLIPLVYILKILFEQVEK